MVDQVRVDCILKIAPPIVWQQDVYRLAAAVACVAYARHFAAAIVLDGVIDAMDYIGNGGEEGVGFDFFKGLGDRFGAERTADLF